MLSPEERQTISAYDRHAEEWSNGHLDENPWEKEIRSFKKLLPGGRILEIGCGGGRDARELIKAGYDYLGTDISSGLLEQARKNNPGADFERVSLYDLDYDDPFDGFWCAAVLLHIPKAKIDDALRAVKRNVKPGALGFIAIKEGVGEVMEPYEHEPQERRLFAYWTDDEFSQKLGDNGFEIVKRSYQPLSERTRWLTYIVKAGNNNR